MIYDLEERTRLFSKNVLEYLKNVKINYLNKNIVDQLLRSATSIGANYCEANNGSSKKDFINKISICRKEARETEYWVELLGKIELEKLDDLRKIWQEAHELTLIFGKVGYKSKF